MSYMPKEQRRAQIVEAALDIMRETGLAAATVRAVAGRIGASQGQIHHHFASADALRAEAFRIFGARLHPEMRALHAGLRGIDRVMALLTPEGTLCDAGVKRMWKEAIAAAQADALIQEAVAEVLMVWVADLTAALAEAAGVAADARFAPLAQRLVGLTLGCDLMRDLGLGVVVTPEQLRRRIEVELALLAAPSDRQV